jgi:hypothetical protein
MMYFIHNVLTTSILAVFRMMILLQEYKCTDLVNCVTDTP